MKPITYETVKAAGWLVFEAVVGSRAYGLNTASSDTDIRGVYVVPKDIFYSLDYPEQVSNQSNDIVYYELRRFMELLVKNNPNIMELLALPEQCVLDRHPVMNWLKPELLLSKLCEKTFANYAFTQIKKAYGLEKKIMKPMDAERKSVLDFCFVYDGHQTCGVLDWLSTKDLLQNDIGLAAVSHLRDCYNLYHKPDGSYSGIVRKESSNEVALSSIPKGEEPLALLYFNRDGYSVYCKQYREYWDWVAKRNEDRYNTTMEHGKRYDAKNMMHVFRLLLMAKEIAIDKRVNVFRQDREFLLCIKAGKFEYNELVAQATALKDELPALYAKSGLPEEPDEEGINQLLIKIRQHVYAPE